MKKTILSISIGLLLLTGCSKENVDPQIEQRTGDNVYVFNTNGEDSTWESITLDEFQSTNSKTGVTAPSASRDNSVHTHGNTELGPYTFNWSGTENSGGTHGQATVTQQFGPTLVTIHLETACVNAIDNAAVYGGTITMVENDPFGGGGFGPFALGNIMFFKVFDNGEGINAPADQIVGTVVSIGDPEGCNTLGNPNSGFWSLPFFENVDVVEPGSVKINN
jgi:hypothetical protein